MATIYFGEKEEIEAYLFGHNGITVEQRNVIFGHKM